MRLLLFFVSVCFSVCFYLFYNLSLWKDFMWNKIIHTANISWLYGNLLIESFCFFIIWMFFVFYFSPFNSEKSILINKKRIFYLLFYIILVSFLYFTDFYINFYIKMTLFIFVLWDFIFNFISNLKIFKKNIFELRLSAIILNYISIFLSVYYIYFKDNYIYLLFILFFSIFFNYFVHKNYTNYISFLISIFIWIYLFYIFILEIYEIYILLF